MGELNLCKYNEYNKEFLVKVSNLSVIIDSEAFQFLKCIPTPPPDHANQTFPQSYGATLTARCSSSAAGHVEPQSLSARHREVGGWPQSSWHSVESSSLLKMPNHAYVPWSTIPCHTST